MVYPIADIIAQVRILLDNNKTDNVLIETDDIDTLDLDKIIASHIERAVKLIESVAPIHMVDSGYHFGSELYWNGDATGRVILPDDFMRLIVFKMSDWESAVYTAITENTAEYRLQSSRFKGLRGSYQKPVVAILKAPEGLVLEFYSCKNEDATVQKAMYLPLPKIQDEAIEISERCYDAVLHQIAMLTKMTLGEDATIFNTLIKELLT